MAVTTQRIATPKSTATKPGGSQNTGSTPDSADEAPAKRSKKKLVIIAVMVLLVGGLAAKFTVLKAPAKPAPPKPGAVVTLDEMTVNLAGGHYLRVQIAIETVAGKGGGHGSGAAAFETAKASQAVISVFSDRKMTDLAGEKSREAAKKELLKELQAEYPKQIYDVMYTAFVMQ